MTEVKQPLPHSACGRGLVKLVSRKKVAFQCLCK